MATKAQRFRVEQQRNARPPKPKQPPKRRRDVPVDTSLPGVSASDRKVGQGSTAARNRSERAARKGGARLEDSKNGKPSRKSTRRSEGHMKPTSNLERRRIRKTSAPETKAAKWKKR
jgi:hypothetical protein